MDPKSFFKERPEQDYEAWSEELRSEWGRHYAMPPGSRTSVEKTRHRTVFGLTAMAFSCSAGLVDRTQRDVRLDNFEHFYAAVLVAGSATIIQNDHALKIRAGDIVLVDAAKAVTYSCDDQSQYGQWLCLRLPRQSLIAHLGFEPNSGARAAREGQARRLLYKIVCDTFEESECGLLHSDPFMQLTVFDLIGALFTPGTSSVSLHTDKVFARICNIMRRCFTDPDVNPNQVAAEAGISLRYLQKLFTARGTTYGHFLNAIRLDHAAHLLQRRASMKTRMSISAISYECGFRDYTHFARIYRQRFGHSPSVAGNRDSKIVRAEHGESTR